MDKGRKMKLCTLLKEIKVHFFITTTNLPISPKWDWVTQHFKMLRHTKGHFVLKVLLKEKQPKLRVFYLNLVQKLLKPGFIKI